MGAATSDGPDWVVIAEQHQVATTPSAVQEARLFLDAVAKANGSEYDGWEASL